jgi:hypothetical protein
MLAVTGRGIWTARPLIAAFTTLALTAGREIAFPIFLDKDVTTDTLSLRVSTAVGGSTFVVGVRDAAADGSPDAVIVSGSGSSATTGAKEVTVASTTIQRGLKYLCIVPSAAISVNATTSTVNISGFNSSSATSGFAGFFTTATNRTDLSTIPNDYDLLTSAVPDARMLLLGLP